MGFRVVDAIHTNRTSLVTVDMLVLLRTSLGFNVVEALKKYINGKSSQIYFQGIILNEAIFLSLL